MESGGRSESERLSRRGAASGSGLGVSFLRKTDPRMPINRIAAARPTCVSRFMVTVSGLPDP